MTPTLFDKLEPLATPKATWGRSFENYTYKDHGGRYIQARWNHMFLICTLDPDGHCEISFTIAKTGAKPNDGPINKFFEWWGCRPLEETKQAKHCRHFLVREGQTH